MFSVLASNGWFWQCWKLTGYLGQVFFWARCCYMMIYGNLLEIIGGKIDVSHLWEPIHDGVVLFGFQMAEVVSWWNIPHDAIASPKVVANLALRSPILARWLEKRHVIHEQQTPPFPADRTCYVDQFGVFLSLDFLMILKTQWHTCMASVTPLLVQQNWTHEMHHTQNGHVMFYVFFGGCFLGFDYPQCCCS